MSISAETVKQLRERTGAGMMECKRALVETQGDIEAAAELMRKQGLAKADKKAARVAAEGVIAARKSADGRAVAAVEVNCETDFVAREGDFRGFASEVAALVLDARPKDLNGLLAAKLPDGQSVDERRRGLIAKIGENITVRRFSVVESDGPLGVYLHGSRIVSVVALAGGTDELAHDLAMHVAASNPAYLAASDVPADVLAKEREIETEKTRNEGKPAEMIDRIVDGKLRKFTNAIALLGQPFVKDDKQTIEKLVTAAGATIRQFERIEVGAGIEKKQDDFVGEVMAQVKASSRESESHPATTKQ